MSDLQIEALRAREEAGDSLSVGEQALLTAFYARVEAEEEARLGPHRVQARTERAQQFAHLEALLQHKRETLQKLESLVREIEALREEETRLRAAVHA